MKHTPEHSNRALIAWMFGFLAPVKGRVILSCAYLIAWIVVEVGSVRITAEMVNTIPTATTAYSKPEAGFWSWISGPAPEAIQLRGVAIGLMAVGVLLAVLSYLREVSNGKFSMFMVYGIREAVYDKLQRVGFAFHDRLSTGELINRALSDLQNVRQFISTAVLTTLEIAMIVIAYEVLLFSRSPWVAMLALFPLPIWSWYIVRFSRTAQPAQKAVMEAGDRNVALITEAISGVHVIKGFGTERRTYETYSRNCDEYLTGVMHRIRLFANFQPVIRGIASASHLCLFLAGGVLMIQKKLLPGDLLMLGASMSAILHRLQQVSVINDHYQAAIVSARRLQEVLSSAPTVQERKDAKDFSFSRGDIRFENVTFGYDANRPVLHDISFEVPGGSLVAIVGPVGAGKTTLAGLLSRFYDPQAGRILIDGIDIRDVTLASLRRQIGHVFQETFLFSDTIRANIAYGQPDQQDDRLHAVSLVAQADEFIKRLPRDYDTALGERGMTLSGGQRQRLAIARALQYEPTILILDDATAALDPETEELVHGGVRQSMNRRMVFVVAHRISTVRRADVIVVLENGRLTQMGTHQKLLTTPGYYRDIAQLQLEQFEETSKDSLENEAGREQS